MATALHNILSFTGLAIGVPVALPHRLNANGLAVVPRLVAADGAGYTITADTINVTVTRGATAAAAVNVYVEYWHTIENAQPLPGGIATSLFPFVVQGGGSAGGGGGIQTISGGTTNATGPGVSFANGNNITFGINGNTITASVQTAGGTATGVGISAGTESAGTGAVVFSNSNGISFGMNASTITAIAASLLASGTQQALVSASGNISMTAGAFMVVSASQMFLGGSGVNINGAGTGGNIDATAGSNISLRAANTVSLSAGTLVNVGASANGSVRVGASNNTVGFFGQAGTGRQTLTGNNATAINNLFGILGSHGLISNNATVSAFATGNFGAIAAGTQTATSGTINFANSNGITFGMSGSSQVTASYTQSTAPNAIAVNADGSVTAGTVVFSNSNNISFGINGSTITATVAGGGETPFGISAGTQSVSTGTVVFSNSNGLAFGMSGSSRITGSYSTLSFSNANGVSFGINGSTITASVAAPSGGGVAIAAGTQTATSGTVAFSQSFGVNFGMSGSTQVTGRVASVTGANGESVQVLASGAALLVSNVNSNVSVLAGGNVLVNGGNATLQAGNVMSVSGANSLTMIAGQGMLLSATSGNIAILAPDNGNSEGITISAGQRLDLDAGERVLVSCGTAVFAGTAVALNAQQIAIGQVSSASLGFYGSGGLVRQTVTGASTNASLIINNLLAILGSLGIISNGVT